MAEDAADSGRSNERLLLFAKVEMAKQLRDKACSGCAFTSGAAANREPTNFIRAHLALLGGRPFYCHDNIDWQNFHCQTGTPSEIRKFVRDHKMTICKGWQRETSALAKAGFYKDEFTSMLRDIAGYGFQSLELIASSEDQEAKDEAHRGLQWAFRELIQRARVYGFKLSRSTPAKVNGEQSEKRCDQAG
jgi:hypothetical protein